MRILAAKICIALGVPMQAQLPRISGQRWLVTTGGGLIKHAWHYFLLLAEGHLHWRAPVRPDAATDLGAAGTERLALRLRLQNLAPREEG